jgi:DNA-binding beta-propeller fold protein YncE
MSASTIAAFSYPVRLVHDPAGCWYVSGSDFSKIRKINDTTLAVSTLAGSTQGTTDGIGTSAKFSTPFGLALSPTDNMLYVADFDNNRVRAINRNTIQVTTLAGKLDDFADGIGTSAALMWPNGADILRRLPIRCGLLQ